MLTSNCKCVCKAACKAAKTMPVLADHRVLIIWQCSQAAPMQRVGQSIELRRAKGEPGEHLHIKGHDAVLGRSLEPHIQPPPRGSEAQPRHVACTVLRRAVALTCIQL
jgi:hypothetical protein